MMTAKTSDVRSLVRDALGVVFKRKRLIFGLFLIVAVAISAAILSIPNSYEVTGKLVVTRSRSDLPVSPAEIRNFNFAATAATIQDMAVHAELLKNRSLLQAVAKRLDADRKQPQASGTRAMDMTGFSQLVAWIPGVKAAPPGKDGENSAESAESRRLDGVIDSINAGLTVQIVPNSNLIVVRFRGPDPAKGAKILNLLLDLYLDQYLNLYGKQGVPEFFSEQRDQIEQRLRSSEAVLRTFQERVGLLSANVQVDAYSRRLAEAENNTIDAQFDFREAQERAETLRAQITLQPERIQKSSSIKYNPLIQTMRERLLTLEMDLQRLLALYTENDRRVTDKQGEIEVQKQRIVEVERWVPDSEVTEINQVRRDLEDKLLSAQFAANKNKLRLAGSRKITEEMRARVREIGLAEVEKETLMREVQANSEAYLLYRKKAEEARIMGAMDQSRIMNVAIGEPASREGAPVGPPKSLSLLFAVMVGLVSGTGAAFLRELFDGSIKSEGEIRAAVDLPVLGSIPEEKNGKNGKNGNGTKHSEEK